MSGQVGNVYIISAPSGTGKTTLIKRVREILPDLHFSVSVTTRSPRADESDGRDYHFLSDDEFDDMVRNDQFLEWAQVHGKRYGTLREETEHLLKDGVDVIFDIDVQGAQKIMDATWEDIDEPEIITIFIFPPDLETLRGRLTNRPGGTNNIEDRLAVAGREMEIGSRLYIYRITNGEGSGGIALAVNDIVEVFRQNGAV